MMHRFPLPTDAEIEKLISQVYEGMLNPEQSRLSLVESKLLRETKKNKPQKNLNKIPWWIVLVLVGGFASAAWWAGELLIHRQNAEITDELLVPNNMTNERELNMNGTKTTTENKEQDNGIYEDNNSPIIYQRDSF